MVGCKQFPQWTHHDSGGHEQVRLEAPPSLWAPVKRKGPGPKEPGPRAFTCFELGT
jgi:hypothetical protein